MNLLEPLKRHRPQFVKKPHHYAVVLMLAAVSVFGLDNSNPAHAQLTARVTIDAAGAQAKITPLSLGVNTAVWDDHLTDSAIPDLLREIGVTALRYPGGSTSDIYHWKTNADTSGNHFKAANGFDGFMRQARNSGAQVIVTVNYGSNAAGTAGGDPAEAAAWVDYANNVQHYGVKYWEIGNEIYGNGFYNGSGWEEDLHAPSKPASARRDNAQLSPSTYGRNVAAFASAMKAKDPTIKIGVVLTTPGQWPDGATPAWNPNVLAACGKQIDFAIIHYYPESPGHESDSGLLASTSQIAPSMAPLRALLQKYCGRQIPVILSETNSVSFGPGKQSVSLVNALYAADNILAWLGSGVSNVDWWDVYNGPTQGTNLSPSLYGTAAYGDYGLLSNGAPPEPLVNTPQPTYYGMQMIHTLAHLGDTLTEAHSDQPLVAVHAVRKPDGGIDVMLIDKDPDHAATVQMSISGGRVGQSGTRVDYGPSGLGKPGKVSHLGPSFTVTVPAYTITDLIIPARN